VAVGEMACSEPLATARLLVLATNALLPSSFTLHQLGSRADLEARSHAMFALLLSGLRAS
jgi:hypothetical protein